MGTSKNSDETKNEAVVDQKQYFQKVLDDVVSLNGLFTVAIFIGLTFAQPGNVQSLHDDPSCNPDVNMRKRVVAYEIASFSFFVFSGITAKSVKVFLYTSEKKDALEGRRTEQSQGTLKQEKRKAHQNWMCVGGFYLSIYGTMVGCLLLLLAMVDVVQIKLGRLACHSKSMVATVSVMISVIGLSLLIYFFTVTNGLKIAAHEIKEENKERKEKEEKEKMGATPQETEQV